MVVTMKNDAGLTRQVKVGFSWTAFFFGPFPFLFGRGMPLQFLVWLIVGLITFGLGIIYLWFAINKMTAKNYLEKGYKPTGTGWNVAGPKWGIEVQEVATQIKYGSETQS